MNKIISKLKHMVVEVIPTAVFFFIAFQVIAITRDIMLETHGTYLSTLAATVIGALVISKVVVVVDLLPFMNRFPDKPLIFNVLWKTGFYFFATLLVRYLEHIVPLVIESGDLVTANSQLFGQEGVWPRFWFVQIWLIVLFLTYNTVREFGRVLGRERVLRMFFGPSSPHTS